MLKLLLPVSNFRQQQQADCLAACAAMVLIYLHIPFDYERIIKTLLTGKIGTPFHNLDRLASRGVFVRRSEGNLAIVRKYLEIGLPLITAVYTRDLPHWQTRSDINDDERQTDHAVVIVGLADDDAVIYINDPDFDQAPQLIPEKAFMLAWSEHDYYYAAIGLASLDDDID
ncbi:MAG: cysteine peptidase family C39 domain-containing protein [Caldilineaceae bacterium]